jgi:hypothetical protein
VDHVILHLGGVPESELAVGALMDVEFVGHGATPRPMALPVNGRRW